ncbi:MAG: winged helix-turn-helix transcriptional regulator [Burkholderiales bacterium]|nr:winged helix-turn-helix transcriptional regulator [Burkholderiales bacterium]
MSPAATEYRFTDQIGHLLRRAYQRHVAIFQETVPDTQLTAAQFVVLCTLRDEGSCRVPRIVEATAIDEASVRGIVERLKWRGLVTATHEPGDARRTEVALTPAGRSLVEQTVPIAEQISELTFGTLTADERATVVGLLRKLAGMAPS